jgi:tyrosyl-tRNA synthetase
MKSNFIQEIKWRGMIHDMIPGVEEYLLQEKGVGYVGVDPTADSLHIGHLVSIMMLKHFQRAGHQPIILLGGATGMIGDPSGKSQERNLLDNNELKQNQSALKKQLDKLLDFDTNLPNHAIMVNNYDWMSNFSFLEFIRDIGKHITVNYMMSKDSVKKRLGEDGNGLSFTEFSYQLVQATDFLHLYQNHNCKLQMGGSDQWGNITTGTELIRRKTGGSAYAITCPLITKSDGGKFGKTEQGNIWLDPTKTSPYTFYQFWLNVSDEDAEKFIKIFTILDQEKVDSLIKEHQSAPHIRTLQKQLAQEMMLLVHNEDDLKTAVEASEVLFGNKTIEALNKWKETVFNDVFEGVPQSTIALSLIENEINIIDFLAEHTNILSSKSEARRMLKSNAISVNKSKVNDSSIINTNSLLNNKYLLVQIGKKNYHLVRIS